MYQVVVAREVVDANVDAEEDLTFKITAADFIEILWGAGVPEEAAQALQVKLYDAGYGRALPWVSPVRAELAALGIGSGFIDGIVTETKKCLLGSVGVAYLQALVGGGDTTADIVKTLREGKGAPTYSPVYEKYGYLPEFEAFLEETQAIIGFVDVVSPDLAFSMAHILEDWEVELSTLAVTRRSPLSKALGTLLKGPCKVGGMMKIVPHDVITESCGLTIFAAMVGVISDGQAESLAKQFKTPNPITQPHMVESGLIAWKKMRSRLIQLGKAVGRDDDEAKASLLQLLRGSAKGARILKFLEDQHGSSLGWRQIVTRFELDTAKWAKEGRAEETAAAAAAETAAAAAATYPPRPKPKGAKAKTKIKVQCMRARFMGSCSTEGTSCPYLHDEKGKFKEEYEKGICMYFASTGRCSRGSKCEHRHEDVPGARCNRFRRRGISNKTCHHNHVISAPNNEVYDVLNPYAMNNEVKNESPDPKLTLNDPKLKNETFKNLAVRRPIPTIVKLGNNQLGGPKSHTRRV